MSRIRRSKLTHERLRELLRYDPATGVFMWRRSPRYQIEAGDRAGCEHGGEQPWRDIYIDGLAYRESRLAWLYMTGEWPQLEIDHRNRNPLDSSWANLRLATSTQIKVKQKLRRDNKTGFKGVHRRGDRFYARTRIKGKYEHLGMFDTAKAAHERYQQVRILLHGEFAA